MIEYRTRREIAAPIIKAVLAENKGKDLKEIRAALRQAYPWGMRKYWPYKVWCNEVRRQLGIVSHDKQQMRLWDE